MPCVMIKSAYFPPSVSGACYIFPASGQDQGIILMTITIKNTHLFEVSWEVCNKVGGIHTVLRSKAEQALKEFGDNYTLVGPCLPQNIEFEETDEACWRDIRELLAIKGFECRFGRWTIPGRPKVILIHDNGRYNKDQVLFHLWEKFGVDSIAGGWDYIEPVLFSTACGEVITTISRKLTGGGTDASVRVLAQFHEWMCGAGLLQLKEKAPYVGTVFTTHATVLGRAMMGAGRDLYAELDSISPVEEAKNYSVVAKHSLEQVSAREADCFTAVSDITAREAHKILGRKPLVTENGINLEAIPNLAVTRNRALESRQKMLEFARKFLNRDLPENSRLLVISGRYEFENKGIDVFLESLARIRDALAETQHVVAFMFVTGGHMEMRHERGQSWTPAICTHRLPNENNDPILISCMQHRLTNQPGDRLNVIFCPVYLSEGDGVFNSEYYELLAGCDFGIFPSKYEPWGYTPLESAAHAVPTVTTDQAGFGLWVRQIGVPESHPGVYVLPRMGKSFEATAEALASVLKDFLGWSEADMQAQRTSARRIAERACWSDFYAHYLEAYESALRSADKRVVRQVAVQAAGAQVLQATSSMQPHFRSFEVETKMPKPLDRLRELAYNLWWCWQPRGVELFARIDQFLWESTHHNPVKLLDLVSGTRLSELAANESYVRLYNGVLADFDAYMKDTAICAALPKSDAISWNRPIAYFSMEFGIHESFPIYSGGLGILSGDHLKSASDLNIPLVAVGLFYKNGYFSQRIDENGNQVPEYLENRYGDMPIRQIRDDNGTPTTIAVELPGRTLYATIWKLAVGRITLYLLDSDLTANTLQDRAVTGQLYVGDERIRVEQEILLGIGGARALRRLAVTPSLCHLNEGHSAFLIFENIRHAMKAGGLSFDEAKELVKSQTVFTTHTPVEAGNERFPRDIIQHYFNSYIKETGITNERFFELGRLDAGENQPFIMPILALKLSAMSNGVSELHGRMSRKMWERVWNGMHRSMVPIGHITNGVHMPTFVAPEMRALLDTYLGVDWVNDLLVPEKWGKVRDIPDQTLWEVKCSLRQQLIAFVRDHVSEHWMPTKDNDLTREDVVSRLRGSTLTIGFARRFAPYKRAYLLFHDLERLERILNNPRRPVQIIFAGKAHPNDTLGADLVRQVVQISQDKRFAGRIVFVENYDLAVAKKLVSGVDVWMNTPRRPYEASGTSGQKVPVNGGINFSVADGWWCEGEKPENGWTIGTPAAQVDEDTVSADVPEANHLYSLLEDTIVPLFYQRNNKGLPEGWLHVMRRSMETNIPAFNTNRMLLDYFTQIYKPTAERGRLIAADKGRLARELADWKRRAAGNFSSLHILDLAMSGPEDGVIQIGGKITATVRLDLGEFKPAEVNVDFIIGAADPKQQLKNPKVFPMTAEGAPQGRLMTYTVTLPAKEKGSFAYGIRVMPYHPNLACKEEMGMVIWA